MLVRKTNNLYTNSSCNLRVDVTLPYAMVNSFPISLAELLRKRASSLLGKFPLGTPISVWLAQTQKQPPSDRDVKSQTSSALNIPTHSKRNAQSWGSFEQCNATPRGVWGARLPPHSIIWVKNKWLTGCVCKKWVMPYACRLLQIRTDWERGGLGVGGGGCVKNIAGRKLVLQLNGFWSSWFNHDLHL